MEYVYQVLYLDSNGERVCPSFAFDSKKKALDYVNTSLYELFLNDDPVSIEAIAEALKEDGKLVTKESIMETLYDDNEWRINKIEIQ